jgi:hypothetical protein
MPYAISARMQKDAASQKSAPTTANARRDSPIS